MDKKGLFITIDGPDGSGKSSVVEGICNWLTDHGFQIVKTKEPGSPLNEACKDIRQLVLNSKIDLTKEAELYLMIADRCNHVAKVVRPALEAGKIVICDRYTDSSYAYQGWGRRNGDKDALDFINSLNDHSTNGLVPDMTMFLMVKREKGLERVLVRDTVTKDRFEKEDLEFHDRVYTGFLDAFDRGLAAGRDVRMIHTDNFSQKIVLDMALDNLQRKLNKVGLL